MRKFSQLHTGFAAHSAKIGTLAVAVASVGLIAACSDSTSASLSSRSSLAFSVGTPAVGDVSAALAPQTVGGHTLDLTQVTLTIARAELKLAATNVCADDQGDDDNTTPAGSSLDRDGHGGDDGCAEIKIGPATVDLPLTGNVVTIPADAIPAGTYREIEIRVSNVELKGTFDTTPFDVMIPVNAKAEIEFDTPLVVADGQPTAITVNVPVNTWLVNADGSLVDPNTILANPALLAQVKNRIAASLRAFEDEDHDGRDDHSGPGHSGNGSHGGSI
jgi:hypothetical protein